MSARTDIGPEMKELVSNMTFEQLREFKNLLLRESKMACNHIVSTVIEWIDAELVKRAAL